MSRILRHRSTEGAQTGWFESDVLKPKLIDEIKNPDEKTVDAPPRSIPSPFAPLDLARSAMERYTNGDESPQVRRIVSDVLDVGVLFFTLGTRTATVDCLHYDFADLAAWQQESSDTKAQLPAAMSRYRRNDAKHYGFDRVSGLCLLREKNNPEHVLGGTSPQTMFFVAPSDKPWARHESLGGDTLFDADHKQLHERYSDFVLWIYRLGQRVRQEPGGAETPFIKYIDYCLSRKLDADMASAVRNDLASGEDKYQQAYQRLSTTSDQREVVVYGNVALHGEDGELHEVNSDFSMAISAGKTSEKLPLAIPQSPAGGLNLLKDEPFDRNKHRPPVIDVRPLAQRSLPGLPGKVYPYLTVDDFLETYLLEIPYPADGQHYLTCYANAKASDRPEDVDYLLPLKPLFFEYFTAADLAGNNTGTPSFTMHGQRGRGYVEFRLNIPLTQSRTATFSRQYQDRDQAERDGTFGGIRNLKFGLAMYPNFVDRTAPQHQRLLYTCKETDTVSAGSVRLFDSTTAGAPQEVETKEANWTQGSTGGKVVANMLQPLSAFDGLRVWDSGKLISGVLIPLGEAPSGSKSFSFAVDFGTTNTHIEVAVDGLAEQPLSIAPGNAQLAPLHGFSSFAAGGFGDKTARDILAKKLVKVYQNRPEELLPSLLGEPYPVMFPIRTATVETGDIESIPVQASLQVCVPWMYQLTPYTDVHTELKWSTLSANNLASKRAEAFIDTLCLVMRNHVLHGGGRLRDTRLVWFYPTSMSTNQRSRLGAIWRKAYGAYFEGNEQENVTELTESLAPMYAYATKDGVIMAGERPAVSVDIGGGSTDIAVWAEGKVRAIDSFRLAGNAVFGDGEGYDTSSNGFIRYFEPRVRKAIDHKVELTEVYQSIKRNSTDTINFWFGLRNHPAMVGRDFDFAKELSGTPEMRVPFVVFFAAIAYRTSELLKAKNLVLPRDLAFSGNGSRMLSYLSDDRGILGNFFQKALQVASGGQADDYRLRQVSWDNAKPKEVTCKGGLAYLDKPDLNEDWREAVVPSLTYSEVDDPKVIDNEVAGFARFVAFLREFLQSYDINGQLGIAPVNFASVWPILEDESEVRTYMRGRIAYLQEQPGTPGDPLGEKLFFFPLRRMLPRIAQVLADKNA